MKFLKDLLSSETKDPQAISELEGIVTALNQSQAVIEFNTDGTIITANDNFLNTLGYRLDEIQGKHHSLFVDTEYSRSREYGEFWEIGRASCRERV